MTSNKYLGSKVLKVNLNPALIMHVGFNKWSESIKGIKKNELRNLILSSILCVIALQLHVWVESLVTRLHLGGFIMRTNCPMHGIILSSFSTSNLFHLLCTWKQHKTLCISEVGHFLLLTIMCTMHELKAKNQDPRVRNGILFAF